MANKADTHINLGRNGHQRSSTWTAVAFSRLHPRSARPRGVSDSRQGPDHVAAQETRSTRHQKQCLAFYNTFGRLAMAEIPDGAPRGEEPATADDQVPDQAHDPIDGGDGYSHLQPTTDGYGGA